MLTNKSAWRRYFGMSGTRLNDWASPAELEPPFFDDEKKHIKIDPPPNKTSEQPPFNIDMLKSLLPMLGKDLGPLGALLGGGKPDLATLLPLLVQTMNAKKPQGNSSVGKTVRLDDYTRINP